MSNPAITTTAKIISSTGAWVATPTKISSRVIARVVWMPRNKQHITTAVIAMRIIGVPYEIE
jgi:hypothetical protein